MRKKQKHPERPRGSLGQGAGLQARRITYDLFSPAIQTTVQAGPTVPTCVSPHHHGISLLPGCQVAFGTNHTAVVSSCPDRPQKQEVCSPPPHSSSLEQHGKPSPSWSAQNIQEAGHTGRIKQHSTISLLRYKLRRSVVTCAGATCSPKLSLYSTHQPMGTGQSFRAASCAWITPYPEISSAQRALSPPDTVLTPYVSPAGMGGCWCALIPIHLIAAGDPHSE